MHVFETGCIRYALLRCTCFVVISPVREPLTGSSSLSPTQCFASVFVLCFFFSSIGPRRFADFLFLEHGAGLAGIDEGGGGGGLAGLIDRDHYYIEYFTCWNFWVLWETFVRLPCCLFLPSYLVYSCWNLKRFAWAMVCFCVHNLVMARWNFPPTFFFSESMSGKACGIDMDYGWKNVFASYFGWLFFLTF